MALVNARAWWLVVLAMSALLAWPASTAARAEPPREASEARVKAAFLFKFGDYVEWPPASFTTAQEPLRIGLIDAETIAAELEAIGPARTIAGRQVQVRRMRAGDPLDGLDVVFVGGGRPDLDRLLPSAQDQPTLVVTEAAALPRGSIINFVPVAGRMRFDVSLPAAQARGLRISSRLLALARTVEKQ